MNNLRLPYEKEGALKIFAVLNTFVIILEFWVTRACPEKKVTREFIIVLKYILSFRVFEQLLVTLTTEFALKFYKPGEGRPS